MSAAGVGPGGRQEGSSSSAEEECGSDCASLSDNDEACHPRRRRHRHHSAASTDECCSSSSSSLSSSASSSVSSCSQCSSGSSPQQPAVTAQHGPHRRRTSNGHQHGRHRSKGVARREGAEGKEDGASATVAATPSSAHQAGQRQTLSLFTDNQVGSAGGLVKVITVEEGGQEETSPTGGAAILLADGLCPRVLFLSCAPRTEEEEAAVEAAQGAEADGVGSRSHPVVLYQFPPQEQQPSQSTSPGSDTLVQAHGLFVTLYLTIKDLVESEPRSSTLRMDGEVKIVSYVGEEENVLLLVIPVKRAGKVEASLILGQLKTLLCFRHQSLKRALTDNNLKSSVDDMLYAYFSRTLFGGRRGGRQTPGPFEDLLPAAPLLPMPKNLSFQVNQVMSSLEANMLRQTVVSGSAGCPSPYTVLGSCLFFKELLVCSHLPYHMLVSVHLWVRHVMHCRAGSLRTSPSSPSPHPPNEVAGGRGDSGPSLSTKLVSVQRVFPPSLPPTTLSKDAGPSSVASRIKNSDPTFILLVTMGYFTMAVLMESFLESEDLAGPDLVHVQKVLAALGQIQKLGVAGAYYKWFHSVWNQLGSRGLSPIEEHKGVVEASTGSPLGRVLSGGSSPNKSSAGKGFVSGVGGRLWKSEAKPLVKWSTPSDDQLLLLPSYDSSDELCSGIVGPLEVERRKQQNHPEDILQATGSPLRRTPDGGEAFAHAATNKGLSNTEEGSSSSSDNSFCTPPNAGSKGRKAEETDEEEEEAEEVAAVARLGCGLKECVLYFVHLESGEGVLLNPPPLPDGVGWRGEEGEGTAGALFAQVMHNFRSCCQTIHCSLQGAIRCKEAMRSQEAGKQQSSWAGSHQSLLALKEVAVLFSAETNTKKGAKGKGGHHSLHYWVVGRLFCGLRPREVYICYEESSPQNMVEMAFRLGQGLLM